MRLTNVHGLSLPLAVWLVTDDYDYVKQPNYISATSLLKSTRQTVLSKRVPYESLEFDISDFLSSRTGTAIHDSIEKAWATNGQDALKKLGYPPKVYENLVFNPTDEQIEANPDIIPVWMEQRMFRQIEVDGETWTIGGKFDMVLQGRLFDTKTTSVYSYLLGRKDDDYAFQGGVYRWLDAGQEKPKITSDQIFIQFIFTDWQKERARNDPNYPQTKAIEYPVALPSIDEVDRFVRNKIREIIKYRNASDEDIPHCNDKELWRSDPVWKYYADPTKTTGKSTKNFDNPTDAQAYQLSKGGKGVIIKKDGDVRACTYCPAFKECKQKDLYFVA